MTMPSTLGKTFYQVCYVVTSDNSSSTDDDSIRFGDVLSDALPGH